MVSGPVWPLRAGARFSGTEGRRGESDLRSQLRPSGPGDSGADQRFPRSRRIRKRADYLRVQNARRGRKGPHFVLIDAPGPTGESRLGVTVSRRVGGAVERNRVKRRVREFFRKNRYRLQPTRDLVIIARPGAELLSLKDVESELAGLLRIKLRERPDGA